jgi:hypothetical protein
MKILAIETSCDETAAAVIENGTKILSNVVVSQIDLHSAYGGVVPELAARSHIEAILPVVHKALTDANLTWNDVDALAVTDRPGLIGSLLIGTLTARTLAILHNKPLYPVHHLKSHIYANWLTHEGHSDPSIFPNPFSRASSPAKPDTYIPDVTDGFAQSAVPSADQRMTWQVEAGAREKAARETQYSLFTLYENLSVLKEALMTHVKTETPKLKDLIVMLDDYAAAKEPLTNTSPYQTAESAVHILSAHKAKGLEFSHVFLISVDDAAWGNATGNNNTFTLPKNLAHIRHTGITEDERLRLFFVAITRAKTHLYLTSSGRDFSGKAPTPLEYLEEADNLSPLLPEKTQKIIIHDHDDPDPAPLKTHWSLRYAPESPDLTHILKKKLENYRLTPTDLTTFVDIVYAGPLTFYAEKLLGSPRPPLEPKQAYGNFVHAVLDFGTKNKTTDDTALFDLYKTLVGASVFSAGEKSALLAKGTLNLPKILHKLSPNFRAPSTLSEVNFKSEHVAVDGVPITGNIDQLLIDEPTKTITIVDFKTTSFDPQKSWTNSPRLLMYRLQLGFYKLLLNNSPKYKNYHVATALLEHLNPNDDGEIITRPYNFNAGDEEELKSLITSVYTHIKSLDFPPLHPDADYTLKDIKDFIASLIA